ncbi:unnamed protein product [Didymodactylos carnosus]|uniref:G-protein coupled receptors family 1 profile domain-containing protein n=1 Tax=Didymodactylos carnosus TaxID=1234261 RepID=A0A815G070_9BILA|nr:unnamed protein product [Didymodactylos carnosus]CAF1345005.1 unnamed protein product [Didymodactylos carnosus]CAF4156013.1 unnamed protein product [Didymodactylos carnosus]CAF4187204.1 unnamed protein product [Didymodactylos carnosus]
MDTSAISILTILISVQIPAILCSIFCLYHFLWTRELRHGIHNHAIICLLICSLLAIATELPIAEQFLVYGIVYPSTRSFCLFWNYWNFTLNNGNIFIMAWMSIERHLLIFHSNLYRTSRGRLLYHFVPLLSAVVYSPLCMLALAFYPCTNISMFSYKRFLCNYACFLSQKILVSYELIGNLLVPTMIIVLCSCALSIRVIRSKRKIIAQVFRWRKTQKLLVQLILISTCYSLIWIPYTIVILLSQYWRPNIVDANVTLFLNYGGYVTTLLTPFLCLNSIPNLKRNLKQPLFVMFKYKKKHSVVPIETIRTNHHLAESRRAIAH